MENSNDTAAEAKKELALLEKALESVNFARNLRYESLHRALSAVKFPYRLLQIPNMNGRGYLYTWRGSWDHGSVFVNETEAGRNEYRGTTQAVKALQKVLGQFATQH